MTKGDGSLSDGITIRADWTPPPGMGVNAHTHWRHKHPDEKNAYTVGKYAAVNATARKRWECPEIPVLVAVIHWEKRSRKKDADNALNSAKHLIDGACAGLKIDDRRFLTSMAFQRFDPDRQGFTELIIRPATEDERRLCS